MKKQTPEALNAPLGQTQRRNDREAITRCFVVSRETLHKFHGPVAAEEGAGGAGAIHEKAGDFAAPTIALSMRISD